MTRESIDRNKFPPEEFGQLVEIAIRAGQHHEPFVTQMIAGATSGPYTKAALALREYFGDDKQRFESAMSRFTALMHLFAENRLKRWVRINTRNKDTKDIHPAVMHVAAQMHLNRNGKFPERKFLAAVAAVATEYYSDLPDW